MSRPALGFAVMLAVKVTNDPKDRGKFKTPGLRNVAQTAPYLHDGSAKTLMDVVNLYRQGGFKNPNLDPDVRPLNLSADEKQALVDFMEALTGPVAQVEPPALP